MPGSRDLSPVDLMKAKPILADPLAAFGAGVRHMVDFAVLVHIGRCGLHGATRQGIVDCVPGSGYRIIWCAVDRLAEMGMIVAYGKNNSQVRASRYVVTVKGWELLTRPADFTMFPDAMKPLVEGGSR